MRPSAKTQRAGLIAALLIALATGIGVVSCEAMRQWRIWPWADGLPPPCYGPDIPDAPPCVVPASR